jgi:hypothetical protein
MLPAKVRKVLHGRWLASEQCVKATATGGPCWGQRTVRLRLITPRQGLARARKTAEITVEADTYRITVEPGITITVLRTTTRDIRRHKASNYSPEVPPGVT